MTDCSKCGECCTVIDFVAGKEVSYDEARFYELHGIRLHTEGGQLLLEVPLRCSLLGEDNLCKDYENRPKICRNYQCEKMK